MNKIEKELIQIFAEFGFNVSVGKAYVSLLKNNPATGYEISADSGIPRSAIYSVLKNMESQQSLFGDVLKRATGFMEG